MKIHEHQAKALFAKHGLAVPRGEVAFTPAEARDVAERLAGGVVVKAQIHAGGRGKGGGVKVAASADAAARAAEALIGMTLVTPQTGPEGRRVSRVLVEERLEIDRELYLGLLIDRASARPIVMASAAGGMEIEQVAAETPERILRESIDLAAGLPGFKGRRLAFGLGLAGPAAAKAVRVMQAAYAVFRENDASLVEINPLVVTKTGDVLALDGKVSLDDNALFRHPELRGLRDPAEEEELEIEASKHALNYIRLDGAIGCMVNGAGLAMATMDLVGHFGAAHGIGPANFLDVSGGASAQQVAAGLRIILSDADVRAVLINIFGGITRGDEVARGIMAALEEVSANLPMTIRLAGTNHQEGMRLLAEAGLANVTVAQSLQAAARAAVEAARSG